MNKVKKNPYFQIGKKKAAETGSITFMNHNSFRTYPTSCTAVFRQGHR